MMAYAGDALATTRRSDIVTITPMRRWPLLLAALVLGACAAEKSDVRVINASTAFYEVPTPRNGTAVEPIAQHAGRGVLILHGGGVITEDVTRLIVAYSGPEPTLCLIDTADPGQGQIYRLFDRYSGVHLRVFDLEARDVALPDVVKSLGSCTGYFFGGGAPQRLSEAFRPGGRDSLALAAIRARVQRHGAVVSGSSAGAMIVGPLTLCECGEHSSVTAVRSGELFTAPGFALLQTPVLVDAHFFARGLLGRHMFALARDGLPVGVGIDEGAAVLVPGDDGPWQVVAGPRVAIVRAPAGASVASLHDFDFSVLSPGDRFDPVTGKVLVAPGRSKLAPDSNRLAGTLQRDTIRYTIRNTPRSVQYAGSASGHVMTVIGQLVSVDPI
jgi:cyanophycinase-like exopeptidase